jgi:glycosyltransferase involved in cell wall biosynthesis
MSVYNGAEYLPETLDSVLNQDGCDFEFIVVNDGSDDESAAILDDYSTRDNRLRVIHQENTGLTLALMRGCSEARGEFIARQDAGDISLPGRLRLQHEFLQSNPQAVMCCGAVRFVGPLLEPLYRVAKPMEQLDMGLRKMAVDHIQGPPHHGATLFRVTAYRQAGGYRLPFYVAQDVDLWLRLTEIGQCLGMAETIYEARLAMGSISSRRRDEQLRLCAAAIACAEHRREGKDELAVLESLAPVAVPKRAIGRFERARFHYFIASCLRRNGAGAAKRYYWMAFRDNPFHGKALFRLLFG